MTRSANAVTTRIVREDDKGTPRLLGFPEEVYERGDPVSVQIGRRFIEQQQRSVRR